MAAIQEIQSLISQGQPIPEGLQRNALREAAANGMSNADLANTLGVPPSMVDDAAATLAATPLNRIAEAQEVAETAQFLSTEASGFMTGQIITVDGGRSLIDPLEAAAH